VLATLRLLARLLPEIRFDSTRMGDMAKEGFTLATDLADYLVRKGIPFRKAHFIVGQIVQHCIQHHKELHECRLEDFKNFHNSIEADVYLILQLDRAVDSRTSIGGTGSSRVQEAIREAHRKLASQKQSLGL
jgi:argininosuccinate lyase